MLDAKSANNANSPGSGNWPKVLWRWAMLVVVLVTLNLGIAVLLQRYTGSLTTGGNFMLNVTIALLLVLYALLLAIPFVPGVEIGLSLLISHGSAAAPFVYLATVGGLLLTYLFGVILSDKLSCKFLMVLGLRQACVFVDEVKLLNRKERLDKMQKALPDWAGNWFLKHRCVLLALLLNLPGNSLIGGGGGIAMLAGLSRTFSMSQYIVTISIAVLPVPLIVYLFGTGLLQ